MQTITTIEQLEALIDNSELGTLFVRWSHGPEADAENGWISKNYAGTWCELRGDYDYVPVDEDGLSATLLDSTSAVNRWRGEGYGTVCYILTGRVAGYCSDEEPLLEWCEPVALLSAEVVAEA